MNELTIKVENGQASVYKGNVIIKHVPEEVYTYLTDVNVDTIALIGLLTGTKPESLEGSNHEEN